MLFTFLKKQKEKRNKVEIIKTLILNLNLPEDQKELYVNSLDILEVHELEGLYTEITFFTQTFEMNEVSQIQKESFVSVAGMTTKEAKEKQKEVNAFSFLINNL